MPTPTIQMSEEMRAANRTRIWAKAEIRKRIEQIASIILECEELHPDVFDGLAGDTYRSIMEAYEVPASVDSFFWHAATK